MDRDNNPGKPDRGAYSGHSIWMADLVKSTGTILPFPVSVSALVTIGLIPYLLTGLFFMLAEGQQSTYIISVQVLAATIAVVGPVFIWHYDENVFPKFVEEVQDIIVQNNKLIQVINKYEKLFSEKYYLIVIPWTILIIIALVLNISFFETIGVDSIFDPAFIIYIIFASWWSVITGIGLHGAIITILCVRKVSNLELNIDPLHHDGLGGLSTVGYFSIRATLMNSVGSFAFPLAFAIATRGNYQSLVYTAVGLYTGAILLSFLYPTIYVNRRAQQVRESILQKKRKQIRNLRNQSSVDSAGGDLSELETQMKIQTLRNEFHEYKSVNLYPLTISILTRLASSVLLPIMFTILETYVFSS